MLFLCFNINDREIIAEPLLQHLRSFGFHVWYDRKDIFLGDNRYHENIVNGAGNPKIRYAVVILTKNFDKGHFCKEELALLKQRWINKSVTIFPVIYDLDANSIQDEYKWLLSLVCKFVNRKEESIYASYHIVAKITHDLLSGKKFNTLRSYIQKGSHPFLVKLLITYDSIDKLNYNARMTALYFIFLYIFDHNDLKTVEPFYYKGFDKLFSFTKLNISTDKRELQILENLLALLLSKYY